MTHVHIINHTHWDREWFLTSVYTSRWIPGLIDKLTELSQQNPDFRYLFDGQTLVVEDLLAIAPEYEARVAALIEQKQLQIGPYYCQPDWQLTGGELLIRNLIYGRSDLARFNGQMDVGWLVDTFGHISQSPQIHQLFGLEAIYVWRGVPKLEPYFNWQGADGSQLFAVDLFGGYRNLYGITHAPEVAVERLEQEVAKLRPFYPTPDIPLFDGYDLEDNPEDPVTFLKESASVNGDLNLQEVTPTSFVEAISEQNLPLPTIVGELNSGKYGATFPGVYSARTYLKVMARDCQQLLFQVAEPLAAMARLHGRSYPADKFEQWGRLLLQNAVHDCICGVSIDQVHEKMIYSYRQTFDALRDEAKNALAAILTNFATGEYAVSTNPMAQPGWQLGEAQLVRTEAHGVGVWPIEKRANIEFTQIPVENFTWENEYFSVTVMSDGLVQVNGQTFGRFLVWAEEGDTYSTELGELLGELRPLSPITLTKTSQHHATLTFTAGWHNDDIEINAQVALHLDDSQLIRWDVVLDSRGSNVRVDLAFETGQPGDIFAGMPFDVVQRPVADTDLLPRQLPDNLAKVLLGQRELGSVKDFPFHDFVAIGDEQSCTAVLAKGINAYTSTEDGTIALTLRRSVEWLTKADLRDREGDAGPFFYVPDGRCERTVYHEIAVAVGTFAPESMTLQKLNASFQNPPLIVQGEGNGSQTTWSLLAETLPMSALTVQNETLLARLYNPTNAPHTLQRPYTQADVWGERVEEVTAVPAKKIITLQLPHGLPATNDRQATVTWRNQPRWRVGQNESVPDTAVLDQLQAKIKKLEAEIAAAQSQLEQCQGKEKLRWQHRIYILDRERLEFKLSHLLNTRKLASNGENDYNYLYEPDDEIAEIGIALNRLRIKRRIFDYVATVLD
ncbi:hypothetical protein [Candidatus Leptofilum sp.]|uniref:glycoside hydrolase family 38 N-terminal domain-containing protein n=1 Tax=Candidatus Leptofilum sp. TaxID=3241576 RepID=UPI003B5AEA99